MNTSAQTVYVGWQAPEVGSWHPVARVEFSPTDGYTFAYLQGVHRAHALGFQNIAPFSDLAARYRSADMFAFLKNRVLSHKRDDFEAYRVTLGLGLNPHPLDQVRRSGGRRATDSLEIFAPPDIVDGRAHFTFFLRGVRHLHVAAREAWHSPGLSLDALRLAQECDNPWDDDALLVMAKDLLPMGFVPQHYTDALREQLANGDFDIRVLQHNPAPAPDRLRFRVEVSVKVPADWSFGAGEYDSFAESVVAAA